MFIGKALLKALESAGWRFLAVFLCGASPVGDVRFWFCIFGCGATSSEDVVDRLPSEGLDSVFSLTDVRCRFSQLFQPSISSYLVLFGVSVLGIPMFSFPLVSPFSLLGCFSVLTFSVSSLVSPVGQSSHPPSTLGVAARCDSLF